LDECLVEVSFKRLVYAVIGGPRISINIDPHAPARGTHIRLRKGVLIGVAQGQMAVLTFFELDATEEAIHRTANLL